MSKRQIRNIIKRTYFDISHPYSYSSPKQLHTYLKKHFPQIKFKDVENILLSEPSYTKHKQVKSKFARRKTIVSRINQQWQGDLSVLISIKKHNKGYKYIFFVIDVLSRKLYTRPLKTKKPIEVAQAFISIMKKNKVKPTAFVADRGVEFVGKDFKKMLQEYTIAFFPVYSSKKAAIVERLQRTFKSKMFKVFTGKNTLNWVDILQDLTNAYNNRIHSSIGMAPNKVLKSDENKIIEKQYGVFHKKQKKRALFNEGDSVRKVEKSNIFAKGYSANFSEEIYQIVQIKKTLPITYKIMGENNKILKGSFYANQLSQIYRNGYE